MHPNNIVDDAKNDKLRPHTPVPETAEHKANMYVFILCPPFSGSTLLWKLVSTSDSVSALPKEGKSLPELKKILRDFWNADVVFPWQKIREVWHSYWDHEKPLLVEKSPPHIIRTDEIVKHFSPASFLLMVRNPYAHCEGLMRRQHGLTGADPVKAAKFTIRCLKQQAENARKLPNVLSFTYEELVADPASICKRIESFLPQIGQLDYSQEFELNSIDGRVERGIVDLNKKKISNLSFKEIKRINEVLMENSEVMDFWGYELYEPPFRHAVDFVKTRSSLLAARALSKSSRILKQAGAGLGISRAG